PCQRLPGGTPGPLCPVQLFGTAYDFDERDAVNQRNFFSYGLTSRLLGRPATPSEAAAHQIEASAPPPVDPETLPHGLSAAPVPAVVGPPPPAAPGAPAPLPAARELARVSILHGYDVSRPLVGDSHASDIDFGLRLTPLDYLGFSYNTTVSAQEGALRGTNVGLLVREPWWHPPSVMHNFQNPSSLGISYRFVEKDVN